MTLPFLPIAQYMVPSANFARAKAYGCNCIITDKSKPDSPPETPITRAAYFQAAANAGLKLIIGPAPANPVLDIAKPNLLGFCQPDEADKGSPPAWGPVTAAYAARYAMLKGIAPDVPVFGNFSGGRVLSARASGGNPLEPLQSDYAAFAAGCDAWGADKYIRARGEPTERITQYGDVQNKLKLIAPNKPTFAVIETCDQGLKINDPAKIPANPTPEEVKAMVWLALNHGAQGLAYFTLIPSGGTKPFSWDATQPDVAAALPVINAEVHKYEEFFLLGTRVSNGNPFDDEATWTLPGNGTLKSVVAFDAAARKWSTTITYQPAADPVDALHKQVADLKAKLASIAAIAAT